MTAKPEKVEVLAAEVDGVPEAAGVCESRVRTYLPQGVDVYLNLRAIGCDTSGVDTSLRVAEEMSAETDAVNANQLRLREQEQALGVALEDAQSQAAGMEKALLTLQAINPQPDGLERIIVEADALKQSCEKVLVEVERRHSALRTAFRAGARELETASQSAQAAITDACEALVASAATRASRLGELDREAIEADPYLVEYPHRAPDSIVDHHGEVSRLEEMGLGFGQPYRISGTYRRALGGFVATVDQKVAGHSLGRESWMRSSEPSPDLARWES